MSEPTCPGAAAHAPPPLGAGKAALRRWARARRAALRAASLATAPEGGADPDAAVVAALRASELYRRARTVAVYLAMQGEVDLAPLLSDAKRFVAPRTHTAPTPHLTFHELGGAALEEHPWGMREPPATAPAVPLHEVDLLLVPGLLFDTAGARLGYGGGFYDRLLGAHLERARLEQARPLGAPTGDGAAGAGTQPPATAPTTVGVALEALVVPELPQLDHDVAVDHLVTEAGLRPVRGRG